MGHKVSRNETLVVGFLPSIKSFGMGLGEEKERTSWKPPRGLLTQAHAGSLESMEAMQAFTMSFRSLGSLPSFLPGSESTAPTRTNVSPEEVFTNVYP